MDLTGSSTRKKSENEARELFAIFPLEDEKYLTSKSLTQFYGSDNMSLEEATSALNNFLAGSGHSGAKLDIETFVKCQQYHLEKILNSSESIKMRNDLCKAALQIIGSDNDKFRSLLELPNDLSDAAIKDILREMDACL
jgi:hypothetical protein